MNKKFLNFLSCCSLFAAMSLVGNAAFSAQAPNPRSAGTVATQRAEGKDVKRVISTSASSADESVVRSATRRPSVATARSATSSSVSGRAAARQTVVAAGRPDTTKARSAAVSTVVRSAVKSPSAVGRSATASVNVSRAASPRATAVYDDVSKIGGGYAACREAYSTCMDQFCAKANDTYRRCYCSARYTEFQDTEAALDEAKLLIKKFEDNNLNAVDKTAAEVNAMYSATVGEAAIKNDPSAAAGMLSEIGDLLSGKKKAGSSSNKVSLGSLSLDFSADIGDIWSGGGGSNDLFGTGGVEDLSTMEGLELFNSANKQCLSLISASCENNAVLTMARSSYNILIGQDCNAYEKKVNTQKEQVMQVVRTAEKYLREARLEEYRSHNSADVNECISKVRTAIKADTACGENYKKCLDYTGQYININTGEPIYSPRLFQLTGLLKLENANGNIAASNPQFNKFMDDRQMFATKALDTCRDKSALVWEEFKRAALIEIAQAQDAKIEEVKNSCVGTMAECYDTQSGALASFDNTKSQATGALNAYASRAMCADKVAACAALYAGPNDKECKFDSNGRLMDSQCGLAALLSFVQTVDNVKVAEGCEVGLRNFVESTCAPASGDTHEAPWGCRLRAKGEQDNYTSGNAAESIAATLQRFAIDNCTDPSAEKPESYSSWADTTVKTMVDTTLRKILEDIDYVLYEECDKAEGLWIAPDELLAGNTEKPEQAFYVSAYAGRTPNLSTREQNPAAGTSWGYCVQNTVRYQCIAQDEATGKKGYAKFDSARNTCVFSEEWYQIKCEGLGGYYEGSVCYV